MAKAKEITKAFFENGIGCRTLTQAEWRDIEAHWYEFGEPDMDDPDDDPFGDWFLDKYPDLCEVEDDDYDE
jgi:hypothetical protein